MSMNAKTVAVNAINAWKAENPRQEGETLRQYRRRARQEITADLKAEYGASPWLTLLLQFLPLLLELLLK